MNSDSTPQDTVIAIHNALEEVHTLVSALEVQIGLEPFLTQTENQLIEPEAIGELLIQDESSVSSTIPLGDRR